jgi:putative adhesin
MSKQLFRLFMIAALAVMVAAGTASAQDFQKSYRLASGGQIHIGNISGDVIVTGYDGDSIIVKGIKKGRDSDKVEVEDKSTDGRVDLGVHYPKRCDCDASIQFEVQVPRSVSYVFDGISSVSGDVEISGVTGRVRASAVSGDVRVKNVSGSVSASAVSGDVEVAVDRFEGGDDMKFSSVSGDVNVNLPSSLDADVDLSSFSGSIKTDFPIEVRTEKYGSRTSARGKIGEGSARLTMSSVSGDLSLRHP